MLTSLKENSLTLLIIPTTLEVPTLLFLMPKWSYWQPSEPGLITHQYAFGVL